MNIYHFKRLFLGMKNQENKFVAKQDYDNELSALKAAVRTANEAYSRLSSNVDLLGLPSPLELTTNWLHSFIDERCQAVNTNKIFDAATTARLIEGWRKIGQKSEKDVIVVEKFINLYRNYVYIQPGTNKMEFKDLNALANTRSEKILSEDCINHLSFLENLRSDVRKLRKWEKVHNVRKKPLEWLLTATEDTLKTEWVKGGMTIDFEQERQEYMGAALWLRKAYEESII